MKTKKIIKNKKAARVRTRNKTSQIVSCKRSVSDWVIALIIFIAILVAAIIAIMKIMKKI